MAKRWKVVLEHRTDFGPIETDFYIEELDEIAGLIERGPDWNTLIRIVVTLNRITKPDLTVEQWNKGGAR